MKAYERDKSPHKVSQIRNVAWNEQLFAAYKDIARRGFEEGVFYQVDDSELSGEQAIWVGLAEKPIGLITFYDNAAEKQALWISALWVEPEHRQKGWGYFLVERVRNYAMSLGYKTIQLGVLPENVKMHALMKRISFNRRSVTYDWKAP